MRTLRTLAASLVLAVAGLALPGVPAARAAAPPLPSDRLHFGVANQPASLAWMTGSGVPWRYRYTYLAGGVNTGSGWETWQEPGTPGLYASRYLDSSQAAGYIPVFSYYMLLQSSPSSGSNEADRDFNNLNNAATMNAYYSDFKVLMQRAGLYGGPLVVQVEPDLWGYLQQRSGNTTADRVAASVNGSGNFEAAGLPDTAQGFAYALLRMRDRYAPNALLATHASPWSSGQDIGSSTDPTLNPTAEAARTVTFLGSAGLTPNADASTWDLVFNDLDDHDAGWWETQGVNHWWDPTNQTFPNFNRYLAWVGALHSGTGRPQVSWQVPVGNQYFLTENNTCGHYQDNVAAYFLAHPGDLSQAGLVAVLFGAGNACQTTNEDGQNDGITNNSGAPTSDSQGWCNTCNTHSSQSSDDDGGFLRIFVGQYYATPPPPSALGTVLSARTTVSYNLAGTNDGGSGSWVEMDPDLRLALVPAAAGTALVTANLDLWTARAGYNQDVGIFVSDGTTETLLAWKESGGFAGTFSPNAALVESAWPVLTGHTYVFTIKWKPNRPAPAQTIYAAAGVTPDFSPTRLTVRLLPTASVATAVQQKSYHLGPATDGASWTPIDPLLDVPLAGTGSTVRVSANMDLWTAQAGYNQDLGVFASEDGGPDRLIGWKESGGFAGTYSPNAAFVTVFYPTQAGHGYTFRLKWKANLPAPPATVYGGAGVFPQFSPTRLTVEQLSPSSASSTQNTSFHLDTPASGGMSSWVELAPAVRLPVNAGSDVAAVITANMDLWTTTAGYNQDLGIFSCDSTTADCTNFASYTLAAWKEGGGFAGTYSPNAAAVQAVAQLTSGHQYTFALGWKPNRGAPGGVLYGGAGTTKSGFSPTTLTALWG